MLKDGRSVWCCGPCCGTVLGFGGEGEMESLAAQKMF